MRTSLILVLWTHYADIESYLLFFILSAGNRELSIVFHFVTRPFLFIINNIGKGYDNNINS